MTWTQFGPLIGVIVGAILGGCAQVLNSWLSYRRQSHGERVEAMRLLMDAYYEADRAARMVRVWHALEDKSAPVSADRQREYMNDIMNGRATLNAFDVRRAHYALLDDRPEAASRCRELRDLIDTIADPTTVPYTVDKQRAKILDQLIVLARQRKI